MNVDNYFEYEGCYQKPTSVTDISFRTYLNNDFYKSNVSSVKECEIQSLRNNSSFFLVNDIFNTLNNTNTNCYIPKINNTNTSFFGNDSVIAMSKQLFDKMFFPYNKQVGMDICNTLMYNQNELPENKKCFRYDVDDQVYTPINKYAYYKKPIINETNIQLMTTLDTPQYYRDEITRLNLKLYEELLRININNFENSGSLPSTFKTYICNPIITNEDLLDAQLVILNTNYDNLYDCLDKIISDLSSISHLNSFDDETIKSINLNIAYKSNELNNLFTSGGGNNGRLDDTTLLTQFKIVENSILLLLIISAIFFFTKNKKVV